MTDKPVIKPARFAHVGIQTYDIPRLRDWYATVFGAHVVFEHPGAFCVMALDDEHHRFAIAALPTKPRTKSPANPEIMHMAWAYGDIFDLLNTYERLRDAGIKPAECLNHGPTMSCYYRDPDGNQVELFADCFKTMAECTAWMHSEIYARNFGGGVYFDPDALLARMKAGASELELLAYPIEEGMAVDIAAFAVEYAKGFQAEVDRYDEAFRAAQDAKAD